MECRQPGTDVAVLHLTRKSFLSAFLSLCLLALGFDAPSPAGTAVPAKDRKPKRDAALGGLPITELSADEAILHALNRLAYGPRPGDVERVRQMGLPKWIEQQVNPNAIDDRTVEARLENYPTLRMSSANLLAEYPQPKPAPKQGRATPDLARRSVAAEAAIARDLSSKEPQTSQDSMSKSEEEKASVTAPQSASDDLHLTASEKSEPRLEMNPATRGAPGAGKRDPLGSGDPNAVPRAIADDSKRPQRVVEELAMAKVTRAIYSERQLQQIMDDFWFNHFNVFAGKGADRWLLTAYERDVIEPHSMGKFQDLLTATAKSPAMLFYLDNFLSADPRAAGRLATERAARRIRRSVSRACRAAARQEEWARVE